jgi:hypothetical protein
VSPLAAVFRLIAPGRSYTAPRRLVGAALELRSAESMFGVSAGFDALRTEHARGEEGGDPGMNGSVSGPVEASMCRPWHDIRRSI